jgi:hypothetical protein
MKKGTVGQSRLVSGERRSLRDRLAGRQAAGSDAKLHPSAGVRWHCLQEGDNQDEAYGRRRRDEETK